jgi:arylsulfatase A-like enzyme
MTHAQQQPADTDRPNVIIFLADDLGWADVGFRDSEIDTPNIDRLAREGMELHRFYSTPICSPTRAALMTGRDPVRLGVVYATILPWLNHGIHTEERFMSRSFRDAGYQTAAIGKWHLGHSQAQFLPQSRGFDHFYGHLHTEVGYFPPFRSVGAKDFQRNGQSIDEEGYETYLLAREAVRWIKNRDADKPFFLYVPFLAPHTPLAAPKELLDKYADLKDTRKPSRSAADKSSRISRMTGVKSLRQVYAAVVEAMDISIGQVLTALDEQGIADNTVVLFFSDNGGQAVYGVGGADNYPLRGGKGETFEGGIRVPAVVRWPGHIPKASRMKQMMTVMDVFPTLARLANVPTAAKFRLDGLDFSQALLNGTQIERKRPVVFASETPIKNDIDYAVFDGKWKLMQEVSVLQYEVNVVNRLFDIEADPYEYNDLSHTHPNRVQKLNEQIYRWRALYPINGVRSELVPPPGWRAPKDWANYTLSAAQLQDAPAPGMPPARAMIPLDFLLGERGRIIYNCEPYSIIGGGICK